MRYWKDELDYHYSNQVHACMQHKCPPTCSTEQVYTAVYDVHLCSSCLCVGGWVGVGVAGCGVGTQHHTYAYNTYIEC